MSILILRYFNKWSNKTYICDLVWAIIGTIAIHLYWAIALTNSKISALQIHFKMVRNIYILSKIALWSSHFLTWYAYISNILWEFKNQWWFINLTGGLSFWNFIHIEHYNVCTFQIQNLIFMMFILKAYISKVFQECRPFLLGASW